MKKRFIFSLLFIISTLIFAQSKKLDYYSIGYNDGYNNKKFDSKYSIEKLDDFLKKISDETEKLQFVKDVEAYNLGYTAGICEKQDIYHIDVYTLLNDYIDAYTSTNTYIPTSSLVISSSSIYDWYEDLGLIKTNTADNYIIKIGIYLGYINNDSFSENEIELKKNEIRDFLIRYFNGKMLDELTEEDEKIKLEMRNGINDKIFLNKVIKDIAIGTFKLVD